MLTKLLKNTLLLILSLLAFIASAQTVKKPVLTELRKPVDGEKNMLSLYECASAWGDYNNDGYLDLLLSGVGFDGANHVVLYKNNGNATFSETATPFLKLRTACAVWLDYNNDGNLDLFLAGADSIGKFSGMFKNRGVEAGYTFEEVFDNAFQPLHNGGGNQGNRYAAAADYDNDGWTDLYIQGKNETGAYSILYRNIQGLDFLPAECPVNGNSPFLRIYANTAAWGDYNNDGFPDLLTSGYSTMEGRASTGAYYENNGDGTFKEPVLVPGGVNGEVAWLDYNNDGYQDFIITGYSFLSGIGWQGDLFENKTNGDFQRILPSVSKLGTTQDCSIACGDVNNDGFEDVLYIYSHPNALYLNNFGNRTFTKLNLTYNTTTYDQVGGMVNLVDFDGDHDLDVFTIGYGGNNQPALFQNNSGNNIPDNEPPAVPAHLKADTKEEGAVTFSWEASTDDFTPQKAIRYNLFVQKEGSTQAMFVLPADRTTGRLKVNETLSPIVTTAYKMRGLDDGNYIFGVQSIDNAKSASTFAISAFTVGGAAIGETAKEELSVHKANNGLHISSPDKIQALTVYDILGKTVKTVRDNGCELDIPLPNRGIYILKIETNKKQIIKKTIL